MAPRLSTHHPLAPPGVTGLDENRRRSTRRRRRVRVKQRIVTTLVVSVALGVVGAAAYTGYSIYSEQRETDRVDRERRQAEIVAERRERTATDLIDDLGNQPRWNGPGAPAFGVGEGEPEIDAIVVTGP